MDRSDNAPASVIEANGSLPVAPLAGETVSPSLIGAHVEAFLAAAPEIEAKRRSVREAFAARRTFRPVSLGDWMDLCAKARVPTVAAICLGEAPLEAILRFDEPEGAEAGPFYERANDIIADLGRGYMVRWDCCSMASIKYALSNGRAEWQPEFRDLYADDFRAFDGTQSGPRDEGNCPEEVRTIQHKEGR